VEITLTSRILAAYQFAAQYLGEPISIADIRLGLGGVGDCGPETLYPLLRRLHNTVVDFWAPEGEEAGKGLFNMHEPPPSAPLYELEDAVEINGVYCTHLTVVPRA
jgi:hypothetical protein